LGDYHRGSCWCAGAKKYLDVVGLCGKTFFWFTEASFVIQACVITEGGF